MRKHCKTAICAAMALLLGTPLAHAQPTQVAKIQASDKEASDFFGGSVSISGDRAIVGAIGETTGGSGAGAAYIFELDGSGVWSEVAKIQASDKEANTRFGESVSISGDRAIVGAIGLATGSFAGAAYIFERDGSGVWSEVAKIQASDKEAFDEFGKSVSISGDRAIVGVRSEDTGGSGAGAAYIFERDGSGVWSEVAKIQASDKEAFDGFGFSVSISGDRTIVGAIQESTGGSLAGAAYIFERDGSGVWSEVAKIQASDKEADDIFGTSVSISGDRAIVGASGYVGSGAGTADAAYIFERDGSGVWSEVAKIQPSDKQGGDLFGTSVSISGDRAIVGASHEDTGGLNAGAAYIFERDGSGVWSEVAKIQPSDKQGGDLFGQSISISGERAIVGARLEDTGGSNAGAAYLFEFIANQPPAVAADQATVTVDEGQTASNTGTVSDPDGDTVSLSASVGSVVNNNDGTWSWSFPTKDGPAESQSVTIDADDNNGGTAQTTFGLTVNNVAPTVDAITVPTAPIDINDQPVNSVSATFSDPANTSDEPYTCIVDYDDGSGAQAGTVAGTTCTGPSQTYAEPGVYAVTVTVTDKDGDSGSATASEFIVIYDPAGGFVTGGGWIDSPAGAYPADPTMTGKANFGFVSKYKKGASVPIGQTQFQFKTGNLNFHSTSYDWLVIAGAKAMYKGDGTVNGVNGFSFQLNAIDGEINGGGGVDKFRIKIKQTGGGVIYDNQLGAPDNNDPTTALGGGSIKIHNGSANKVAAETVTTETIPESYGLEQNYPNPFNPSTTITFGVPEASEVKLTIYNLRGQLIRTLHSGSIAAGNHSMVWDGTDFRGTKVASGVYVYKLQAKDFVATKKLVFTK